MRNKFLKFTALIVAMLCMAVCLACGDGGGNNKPSDDGDNVENNTFVTRELLPDPTMKEGIYVSGLNSQAVARTIWKYGDADVSKDPLWFLGQYGDLSATRNNYRSDYNDLSIASIFDDDDLKKGITGTDGENCTLTNYSGSKFISVNPQTGAVTLSVDTRKEYCNQTDGTIVPRRNGEDWVHMILSPEPAINEVIYPSKVESFVMSLDFTVNKCDVYDSSIGADQFQWIFTVHDRTSQINEYFWFLVTLFDNRYEVFPGTQMYDSGKADATGAFMYAPTGEDLFGESGGKVNIGQKYHVELNLKDYMKQAFEIAKQKGAMQESQWEDLSVHGFNIGWEVSNVSDASVTIENMSLKATTVQS